MHSAYILTSKFRLVVAGSAPEIVDNRMSAPTWRDRSGRAWEWTASRQKAMMVERPLWGWRNIFFPAIISHDKRLALADREYRSCISLFVAEISSTFSAKAGLLIYIQGPLKYLQSTRDHTTDLCLGTKIVYLEVNSSWLPGNAASTSIGEEAILPWGSED